MTVKPRLPYFRYWAAPQTSHDDRYTVGDDIDSYHDCGGPEEPVPCLLGDEKILPLKKNGGFDQKHD